MAKRRSQSNANKGMRRFVLGRPFVVLVAPILLSLLVFNHLRKKKKSASAPSFIPPINAGGGSDQYDIFLSFRGSDTRKGFTDHLYRSLVNAGTVPICVFRDDKSLPIGKEFGSQLFDAITRSKISIPIISENYASSKWCLRELVHIMDRKKSTSRMSKPHIVLPIFYKVDPSDVRHLKGSFGKAFLSRKKSFDEKDIQEGKQALEEVSYLSGWESEKIADGYEGELVEKVIKTVLSKLRCGFQLDVTKHLVGVDDQVNIIRNWVNTPTSHAQMIGIYGMGGIGKTTLAKAIYNELSDDFVHRSFLPGIRDTALHKGIPYLQDLLIKGIRRNEDHQVSVVDDGINLIQSTLKGKKVLILLDDVDHQDQLNALARKRDWFMKGSIIIVTTRYKAVLDQSEFQVDFKHELNQLDEEASFLLFKRHAFCMGHCSKDFEDISREIVSTMGGLPLAIKVIGSYLYEKTDKKVWQDELKKLRNELHRDVQKTLRISYDALESRHKEIYLDIACFFIGEDSKFAMYMWEDCAFYPNQGIEELKLRCLIKIGDRDEFMMHDQLRDLGRSIFCQGQQPERCLKLLVDEVIIQMLVSIAHKDAIEWPQGCPTTYTSELFKNLPSSRFLQLCWKALIGDFNGLFSELRWLRWLYIEPDMSSSAINLHLHKLVVLDLSRNKLTEDWEGWSSISMAKRLKVLDLSYSQDLKYTPDLSTFTELEILILKDCCKLEQVHPSIGKVKSLVSLDLTHCGNLKKLPTEVGELEKLKELLLDCAGITEIPWSIGSLRNLDKLSATSCVSLVEIPLSIGKLSSLQYLSLSHCRSLRGIPPSIGNLSSLQCLSLSRSLRGIPSSFGDWHNLQDLRISHYAIEDLFSAIGRMKKLRKLILESSDGLKVNISREMGDLPSLKILYRPPTSDLPKMLEELSIESCRTVESFDLSQLNRLTRLHASDCYFLTEIQGLDNLESLEEIVIDHCEAIPRLILPERQGLKRLKANDCDRLVEIRGLDKGKCLEVLYITSCKSMKTLPDLSGCEKLKSLVVRDCKNLIQLRGLEKLNLRVLDISGCDALETIPQLPGTRVLRNYEKESYGVPFLRITV